MKFISLKTVYKGKVRKFDFHENTTLIYSEVNSVGKSTVLRMLFYSMGYPIPGTESISFRNLQLEVEIMTPKGKIIIQRHDSQMNLLTDEETLSYFLPSEHEKVLAYIFGIDDSRILNNIIGAIYLDQDKGWTLLNRGKVIGNISFNIEMLIEGLTNSDTKTQRQQLKYKKQQMSKYTGLKTINSYKAVYLESEMQVPRSKVKVLTDELTILGSEKKITENQLKEVNKSISQNKKLMEIVGKMNLEVSSNKSNETIPVNENTIVNYSSTYNFLDARKWLLKESLATINEKIDKNQLQLMNLSGQRELLDTEYDSKKNDVLIEQIEINEEDVDYHVELLKNEIKSLQIQIKDILLDNPEVIDNMTDLILDYSNQLGVQNYIKNKKKLLFTNKLKGFSGTVLHKLVISYKLAYVKAIQNHLGLQLPIVLDSPSGREMTNENIEKIFSLIHEEFPNNQIIIASIYKIKAFETDKIIEITKKERIFEGTNKIDLFTLN